MVSRVAHTIDFSNGHSARLIMPPADMDAGAILAALGLEIPEAVLMIFGGATRMEPELTAQIDAAFRNAILPIVAAHRACIIDGATQAGIMEILGRVGAQATPRPTILGVAPLDAVAFPGKAQLVGVSSFAKFVSARGVQLDPNHSHFVLTPTAEWGSETETMFRLATALSDRPAQPRRVAALLLNGGRIAQQEVWHCVRQGWPVLVLGDTGRVAAQIAAAKTPPPFPDSPSVQTAKMLYASAIPASERAKQEEILASDLVSVVSMADVGAALEAAWKRD